MKTRINTKKNFISAVIEEPKNNSKGLVILLPGYLDSKDYFSFQYFSKRLVNLGFTVIRFDPTGTWESGGSIKDYTISQYLLDIEAVISFARNKNLRNIILMGHSLGGMVAIVYAAQHKEISLVISIQPPKMKIFDKPGFKISERDLPNDKDKKIEFKVPFSFSEDSIKYNALNFVSKVLIPTFFISGEFDDVVTPKSVEEIYKKSNYPKQFEVLKNVGHDFRYSKTETQIVSKKIENIVSTVFK